MENKPHLTAISRGANLSKPMKYLIENDLIEGPALDFGCGRGDDADILEIDKYDPYYFPTKIRGKYRTITCNYVLNVLPKKEEGAVIDVIRQHLRKKGKAYISVRDDKYRDGWTSKGTYQRHVRLSLPLVHHKRGSYKIYFLER